MDDRQAILARLRRLGELVFARDPAVVDEMWNEAGFSLYGSEAGEQASTRDALARLFAGLYALPFRIRWQWDDPSVTVAGDVAWLTADGKLEFTHVDRVERQPYRLVAIFHKTGGAWRWRLYSGSEPAPARE
jgi:ketosteroid isomerase-like protein